MGGWGRQLDNVTPSGKVLPCHAAESIPGLEFWTVREHSLATSGTTRRPSTRFRGTDWMPEPCRSCDAARDRLGRLPLPGAGDDRRRAQPPIPACGLSPHHARIRDLATSEASAEAPPAYLYRTIGGAPVRAPEGEKKVWNRAFALVSLVLALGLGAAVAQTPPDPSDLLFDRPQWQAAQAGAALNYRYARKSPLANVFGDDIEDTIGLNPRSGRRAGGAHRAREHALAETPPRRRPLRGHSTGNPVLVLFLENHVETLAKVLKANPRYLKNAIRAGLRDKASVTPTTVEIGGESAPAWRVVTKPFDGDPNKERMRGLDGLTYSFVAADKVPGAIQSISIEAVGADGTRLFSESVTYDATAR